MEVLCGVEATRLRIGCKIGPQVLCMAQVRKQLIMDSLSHRICALGLAEDLSKSTAEKMVMALASR